MQLRTDALTYNCSGDSSPKKFFITSSSCHFVQPVKKIFCRMSSVDVIELKKKSTVVVLQYVIFPQKK